MLPHEHPLRIIRLPEVIRRTGKTQSAIYRETAAGSFPKSIPLGPHTRGWLESEINAWITARVAERAMRRRRDRKKRGRHLAMAPRNRNSDQNVL
jgi:prophage regulatory protein